MSENSLRLLDVEIDADTSADDPYRALVHPDDLDDLDALIELSDVDGVHSILQVADGHQKWRLVEHRPSHSLESGRTVLQRWDVTERERSRDRAGQIDSYWRSLREGGRQALTVINRNDLRIQHVSDDIAAILGVAAASLVGSRSYWHVDRRDLGRFRRMVATHREGNSKNATELRIRGPQRDPRWMEISLADAGPDSVVVSMHDISLRKDAEERLRSSEHLFRVLIQHVGDGVIVVDEAHRMVFLSDSAAQALGGTVESLTGCVVPLTDEGGELLLKRRVDDEHRPPLDRLPAEVRSETERWYELVGHDLSDDRVVSGWVLVLRDVTDRRDRVQRLRAELERDPLTGLLNRRGFNARISAHLAAGQRIGVGFLDLDGFKLVNDDHGHHVGDNLLVEVAARLTRGVRPGDEVARFGGDEFAVAFPNLPSEEALTELTHRLVDEVRGDYDLDDIQVELGVSAGWTLVSPGESVAEALQRADLHMYEQKRQRR